MSLQATCARTLGDLRLDVDVVAPAGEVTVVVGPNGAGKTTLLRILAGYLAVDAGVVALGDRVLDQPPRTFVPPELRRMGVVDQHHLLFSRRSALDNVAFGLRCRGVDVGAARDAAQQWLDRLGVGQQAALRPAALSGGQAQRVALARALAAAPDALLLDEPLAALDATTRTNVRRDLRHHLGTFAGPVVLVTHDPIDALTLADRLVVVEDGTVTQAGLLADVTTGPRSQYLADLLGVNLVEGMADGATVTTTGGVALPATGSPSGLVYLLIPPAGVEVQALGDEGDFPQGAGWVAEVEALEVVASRVRIRLGGPLALVAEVPSGALREQGIAEGGSVWVRVDPTQVAVYRR